MWKRKQIKALSRILLPCKIQSDQFRFAVKKPCQEHGRKTLRVFPCVLPSWETEGNAVLNASDILLLEDEQFGNNFFYLQEAITDEPLGCRIQRK